MDSFTLWQQVASSTQEMIVTAGVPFWEIALGFIIAIFLLFLILVPVSRAFKRLLK